MEDGVDDLFGQPIREVGVVAYERADEQGGDEHVDGQFQIDARTELPFSWPRRRISSPRSRRGVITPEW